MDYLLMFELHRSSVVNNGPDLEKIPQESGCHKAQNNRPTIMPNVVPDVEKNPE